MKFRMNVPVTILTAALLTVLLFCLSGCHAVSDTDTVSTTYRPGQFAYLSEDGDTDSSAGEETGVIPDFAYSVLPLTLPESMTLSSVSGSSSAEALYSHGEKIYAGCSEIRENVKMRSGIGIYRMDGTEETTADAPVPFIEDLTCRASYYRTDGTLMCAYTNLEAETVHLRNIRADGTVLTEQIFSMENFVGTYPCAFFQAQDAYYLFCELPIGYGQYSDIVETLWLYDSALRPMGKYSLKGGRAESLFVWDGVPMLCTEDGLTYRFNETEQTLESVLLYCETNASARAKTVLYSDDAVYFVDAQTVTRQKNGEEEVILDWNHSFLSAASVDFAQVLPNERFLAAYTDHLTGAYYPVILEPSTTSIGARETVHIASLGFWGEDGSMIAESVNAFNRENRSHLIVYRDYDDDRSTTLEEDLLAGVTYDLILFGANKTDDIRRSLEEKNLFADLGALADAAALTPGIRSALTQGDGGLTALPFGVSLSVMLTAEDALAAGEDLTLSRMLSIAKTLSPGEVLFSSDPADTSLRRSAAARMRAVTGYDFVDYQTKSVSYDTDDFIRFAELVLELDAAASGKTESPLLDPTLGFVRTEVTMIGAGGMEIAGDPITAFNEGKLKFLMYDLHDAEDLDNYYYITEKIAVPYRLCGYPSSDGGSVCITPRFLVSMMRNAQNPDGAAAYLEMMLSDRIQASAAMADNALPVTVSAMQKLMPDGYYYYNQCQDIHKRYVGVNCLAHTEESSDIYIRVFARDERYVSQEERNRFLTFLTETDMRGIADETLEAIIEEELSYAASGVRSAAEAAAIIQSRTFIYINE